MSEVLKNCEEDYFTLLEAGFIAVKNADEDSAVKLFTAAQILRPEATFPRIGFGYMHMCKLELKQATEIFEEVMAKEPDNEMAKAFLGITLGMTPNKVASGEKILTNTATKSDDPAIKELANTAIDFVDTFIKKPPSPAQVQSGNKKKK